MKKLPKSLTTVTTFSKTLALIMFILFPILGFFLGIQYQATTTTTKESIVYSFEDCGSTQPKTKFSIQLPSGWNMNEPSYPAGTVTQGQDYELSNGSSTI